MAQKIGRRNRKTAKKLAEYQKHKRMQAINANIEKKFEEDRKRAISKRHGLPSTKKTHPYARILDSWKKGDTAYNYGKPYRRKKAKPGMKI